MLEFLLTTVYMLNYHSVSGIDEKS